MRTTEEDELEITGWYLGMARVGRSPTKTLGPMKRMRSDRPGTFLRIPLSDGSFGYGRVLPEPDTAFYNYRSAEPTADLETIASQPILFKQSVRLRRVQHTWMTLGWRELEGEAAEPVVRYMQDLADFRKCTLFDSAGMVREVGPEECVGIERSAVWEPHHIEERLLDTFMGRPNATEVHLRVRFE